MQGRAATGQGSSSRFGVRRSAAAVWRLNGVRHRDCGTCGSRGSCISVSGVCAAAGSVLDELAIESVGGRWHRGPTTAGVLVVGGHGVLRLLRRPNARVRLVGTDIDCRLGGSVVFISRLVSFPPLAAKGVPTGVA
ncbi:hypothetical protein C8Q78DRAFT_456876 [Trametes maxima]|nr:hypothetical protein C8Q78DRAFT_456876 [Trametes maxima]